MVALYNRLMAIVKSFQQLALTHNEMLLMQALLLVNAGKTLISQYYVQQYTTLYTLPSITVVNLYSQNHIAPLQLRPTEAFPA